MTSNEPWKSKERFISAVIAILCTAFTLPVACPSFAQELDDHRLLVPADNAYDEFLVAASQIDPAVDHWQELNEKELRRVVEADAPALARVHDALARPCVVPLGRDAKEGEQANAAVQRELDRLGPLTTVGRGFLAAIRQAEVVGDGEQCQLLALDLLRWSRAIAYGGLLIDAQKGHAYARAAIEALERQHAEWNDVQLKDAEAVLRSLVEPSESAQTIVERDAAFVIGRHQLLQRIALQAAANAQIPQSIASLQHSQEETTAAVQMLRLRIAVRRYQLEHETALPGRLEELAPRYLDQTPIDPTSQKPFVYERRDASYAIRRPPAEQPSDQDRKESAAEAEEE